MTNSPVTIGGIALEAFEIPTAISFGGEQRLIVHRMSNGARSIELLGPDDSEIRFRGTFSGPTAEARVRALDSLRMAGQIVPLTWQSFQYAVVLKSFLAEYKNPWWISYNISCVVAQQPGVNAPVISFFGATAASDIAYATTLLTGTPVALAPLSTAIGVAGALTEGTTANAQASVTAAALLTSVNSQITLQTNALSSANQPDADPSAAASSMLQQMSSAGTLALVVSARAYVARAGANLNCAG